MQRCVDCGALAPDEEPKCPRDGGYLDRVTEDVAREHVSERRTGERDDLLGVAIGGYTVTRRIGAGGMGAVYLGVHPVLGRKVAIKVLLGAHGADAELRARFVSEARAAAALDSPHVVALLDFAQLPDGRSYIVMEHLAGESLAALSRRRGPLPPAEAVAIVVQALTGLAAAHARGIVHRDLKPANLFLVRDGEVGRVKLLDFGIAKLADAASTRTGTVLGTPEYMSPEQAAGQRELGPRADLYSMGLVLWHLLHARPPFTAPDWLQVLELQRTQPLPLDGLTPALASALARAVEKDAAQRYPDAATMRDGLLAAFPAPLPAPPSPQVDADESSTPLVSDAESTSASESSSAAPSPARDDVSTRRQRPEPRTPDARDPTRSLGAPSLPTPRLTTSTSGVRPRPTRRLLLVAVGAASVVMLALALLVGPRLVRSSRARSDGPSTPREPDPVLALDAFERACARGSHPDCASVADLLIEGKITTRDPARAADLLQRSCDARHLGSCTRLGELLHDGIGRALDLAGAKRLYQTACDGGDSGGCARLGELLIEGGAGITADLPQAAEVLGRGCELGDRTACRNLGMLTRFGRGVPLDLTRAAALFEKACDRGHGHACVDLGSLAGDGEGVPLDLARALRLFEQSCDVRHGPGCFRVGVALAKGRGTAADMPRAMVKFREACDLGEAIGCYNLGANHAHGLGALPVDPPRGATAYAEGCTMKHAPSCFALADLYRGGQLPPDAARAAELTKQGCALDADDEACRAPSP